MPELPEVETVRRGLVALCPLPLRDAQLTLWRRDLRFPVPASLPDRLAGATLTAIERRAKFLLWHFGDQVLISHLGMTGSWRRGADGPRRRHDHLALRFADGPELIYHDPRRFGYLDLVAREAVARHPWLQPLGPEPWDQAFDARYLQARLRGSRAPIKNRLMDARVVVGVGNIYAAESLFRAGISPLAPAGRIGRQRLARLVHAIRTVLDAAIAAGGSTISDFRQAGGSSGYFQHDFRVYGRAGRPCQQCHGTLRHATLSGRATVWCPRCQRT